MTNVVEFQTKVTSHKLGRGVLDLDEFFTGEDCLCISSPYIQEQANFVGSGEELVIAVNFVQLYHVFVRGLLTCYMEF